MIKILQSGPSAASVPVCDSVQLINIIKVVPRKSHKPAQSVKLLYRNAVLAESQKSQMVTNNHKVVPGFDSAPLAQSHIGSMLKASVSKRI